MTNDTNSKSQNPFYKFGKEDTFLTGGGLPGRGLREDEILDEEEDDLGEQLLREVDQYEKDFKKMFAHLKDVEDMLNGEDLPTIQEMILISDDRMKGHLT